MWARNDLAPGTPRPASPWDEWTIPPKPADLIDTREHHLHERTGQSPATRSHGLRVPAATATARVPVAVRKPSPRPIGVESPAPAEPFRPWRVDFDRPDIVEYPNTEPVQQTEPSRVARRLLMLLGLAYLFLTALASGLACTGYFAAAEDDEEEHRDRPDDLPPRPRPPSRDSNAPGLHTRPDGTRYLVMPLPADLADRFRGNASTTTAIGGGIA